MLFAVGTVVLGGVGFALFTPVPATRTMAELRDAGIGDGQKFVLTCPERLTAQTKRRIQRVQPGLLRPRQSYATVSRIAVCFNPDGGNCFRPSDGLLRVADGQGEVVVPSLRRDLAGVVDDGGIDDAGEDTSVDDAFQYQLDRCTVTTCANADAGGIFPNAPCGTLNRLWAVPSECVVPNCWIGDGGAWIDDAVVDCKRRDPTPFATDGGMTTRYAGCNVLPATSAVGAACLPSSCSVVAGSSPFEDL